MSAVGLFSLPERLSGLGLSGVDDVETHPLNYRGMLLGENLGEGRLAKPATPLRVPEGTEGQPGEDTARAPCLLGEEWREHQQQHCMSIRFKPEVTKRYLVGKRWAGLRGTGRRLGSQWGSHADGAAVAREPKGGAGAAT